MAILVVDIGNTSVTAGVYRNGNISRLERMPTGKASREAILGLVRKVAARSRLSGAMVASVVPRVDGVWKSALRECVAGPVAFVRHTLKLGVAVRYPEPETIGADRLANAAGGIARYGAPLIVADFGTAVTFDIITKRGYEGGIIAPGLPLVFDYLAEKTAKLPRLHELPARGAWGRSTEQAMQLGARWGFPGLVQGILTELQKQPALKKAQVVITGGHGNVVRKALGKSAVVDSTLTLYGIGLIFELNYGKHNENAD